MRVSSKHIIIIYIISFVFISLITTHNEFISLRDSFVDTYCKPLLDIVTLSFERANGADVVIEYPAKEHINEVMMNWLVLFKDSFGLISVYTSSVTVGIFGIMSLFSNDDDTLSSFSSSFLKHLKNLFT